MEQAKEKPIQEIPLSVGEKEPAQTGKDRGAALEREVMQLKREVTALRHLVNELERKLTAELNCAEFVEYRGAQFKRRVAGGFYQEVYCPNCHELMRSPQNELNFNCPTCQTWVNIKGHELPEVMKKLAKLKR